MSSERFLSGVGSPANQPQQIRAPLSTGLFRPKRLWVLGLIDENPTAAADRVFCAREYPSEFFELAISLLYLGLRSTKVLTTVYLRALWYRLVKLIARPKRLF